MSSVSRPFARTPFVTFYSFKGGVGRSMALFNVAGILAGRGFRVLAIDFDLEAPGISYLLRNQAPQLPALPGLVDLLEGAVRDGDAADLFKCTPSEVVDVYTHPYDLPRDLIHHPDGELRILPAGLLDERYQRRLDVLDLPGLYREGHGKPLMEEFKKIISESARFDLVLVDSRTGFSDESGICTRDLADHIVIVTGLNHQNIEGTAAFLGALREATGGKRDLLFVLSPVPMGEDELMARREQAAHKAFTDAWKRPVDLSARIYYHPRLALTEEPHVFRSSRGPLYEAYAALERRMRTSIGLTEQRLFSDVSEAIRNRQFEKALERSRVLAKLDDAGVSLGTLILLHYAQLKGIAEGESLLATLVEDLPASAGLHQIAAALHDGVHPLAGRLYERALQQTPADVDILGDFANFLQTVRKDFDGAEKFYRKALAIDPAHVSNLVRFAEFLETVRKRFDGAETAYREALAVDPANANSLGGFATFLEEVRKDFDGAETYYRKALEADPGDVDNLGSFATFLETVRKDFDGAETYYRRAIEADADDARNLGNFADFLYSIREDFDGAERFYRRAIEADPKDAHSLCGFATFLKTVRGEFDGAERYYRRAIEADPDDAHNLGVFAVFLHEIRKDSDGAESYYRRSLEVDPNHATNLSNFAIFLQMARKDVEGAETYYRRAIEVDPDHAQNLGNFAEFLETVRENFDGAEKYYRKALEADPNHADNLGNFARFLETVRGDLDGAESAYRRALEVDPVHASNLGNFADFLSTGRNDEDGAENYYRRALEADPNHVGNLSSFAIFLHTVRRDITGAETYYRRVLEVDPNDANSLGNLAQLLLGQSRGHEGYKCLERAFGAVSLEEEALRCELHFYAYAHGGERWPDALGSLKRLLTSGARSPGWDLQANVQRARDSGHPEPELLAALADVLADAAPLATLEAFQAWHQAT